MERLYDKLKAYSESDFYAFHMPGHKRNKTLLGIELPYDLDITEIDGFDDLHHADGILKEEQERAARVFGAEESHFLVNGSTAGILRAVMGCTHRGDKILVARHCHKSIYHAIYMNGLVPRYVYPEFDISMHMNGEISKEDVAKALAAEPDIKAVVIVSPNYDGVVSDVKGIAEVAHSYRIPLIVDEAHGAHFHFSNYFPVSAADLGADLVIHSGTKFLGGHNDTLAGFLCSADEETAKKIRYIYKTVGSCLAPFDSYLILRGIKTLSVRLRAQQDNAMKIANWLKGHEKVKQVYYVGLKEHPGYGVNASQASGFGSMISFKVDSEATARKLLESVKLIAYAESLGGVESLITYPMLQTHGDLPVEVREKLGITEDFLRLSVGIENADDLIADLEQALA